MDERDFAELISVFLKGNELDGTLISKDAKKPANAADADQSSGEFDDQRSIIEALAKKIKDSQIEENKERVSARIVTEDSKEIETEPSTAIGTDVKPLSTDKAERGREEQLITEEEAIKLLRKGESAEITALRQKLHQFLNLDGVLAALLVTRSGFVVENVSTIGFNMDEISAVIATGFEKLDKIGLELDQGGLQLAMLEYEQGPVLISPLNQDIVLTIVATQWTTLGRIRWEIKKRGEEITANL